MRFNVPDVEIYLNPNVKISFHEESQEKLYDSSTKVLKYLMSLPKTKPTNSSKK